jgi:dTDP-4-dehydrorhamnose 3,5-epimerase-like enzyme
MNLPTAAAIRASEPGHVADSASRIDACRLLNLPTFGDERGNLAVVEATVDIPFEVRRVYYLYDFTGMKRGGHAHKRLEQLFIAISGSFEVLLDDGRRNKTVKLSDPAEGLYVCPMIWREIRNFSRGSVCLVLASTHYDEGDYFRSYEDFVANL